MIDNFTTLKDKLYSGRGITLGMTPQGNPFVGYTLTGRSPSSQARKLVYDQVLQTIRTDVTDPEQLRQGNPALLIYPAIIAVGNNRIVISNGSQTTLLAQAPKEHRDNLDYFPAVPPIDVLVAGMFSDTFEKVSIQGIDLRTYEPDAPNFTPRISGCINRNYGAFHIVRKSSTDAPEHSLFTFHLEPGVAKIITTYHGGNEQPLHPFRSEPLDAKIFSNDAPTLAEQLYDAIGPKDERNYRVAAAVMIIKDSNQEVAIINRSQRGA